MSLKWNSDSANELYGVRTATAIHDGMSAPQSNELNHILNTRPDAIDQRDYRYKPSLVNIPTRFFNPFCLHRKFRVKEQGSEGTCVGQALSSVVELQNLSRFLDGADVPSRISARFLYKNAQLYDHHPDDALQGSSLRGAIKGFYHNGACAEKLARYQVADDKFSIKNAMRIDARRVALGTYFRLEHVLNHYHSALIETGSILCSAIIHDGWSHDSVELSRGKAQFTGRIKYPTIRKQKRTKAELSGGHAFVIVGFDEKGFLVLNSWGNQWGQFPVEDLKKTDLDNPLGETKLRGVAHWSYEDWADNVLDAWILRLTAPTGHGTDFLGGRPRGGQASDSASSKTARKQDVQGHYMHVRDGQLVLEPPYENDFNYFTDIATEIRDLKENKHYRHLVFFAHGGLSTLSSASARAASMIPTFRKNGIYPIFFYWRTGFGQMLGSVIEGILPEVEQRAQDFTEAKDAAIERLAKPIGRAIWNDIRRNAEACFSKGFREYCESNKSEDEKCKHGLGCETAWDATEELIDICTSEREKYTNRKPLKIHFISHSAGVFLLGELFRRMKEEKLLTKEMLGTVNIMVPCCSTAYFKQNIVYLGEYLDDNNLTVFNLDTPSEQSLDPAMTPYSKSFASLVSNSFYDRKPERLAAIDEHWQSDIKKELEIRGLESKVDYILSGDTRRGGKVKCSAAYHGQFDNDVNTMNYILQKIVTKRFSIERDGFTREQLERADF